MSQQYKNLWRDRLGGLAGYVTLEILIAAALGVGLVGSAFWGFGFFIIYTSLVVAIPVLWFTCVLVIEFKRRINDK